MNLKNFIITILISGAFVSCSDLTNQNDEKARLDSIKEADSIAIVIKEQKIIDSINAITREQQIIADSIQKQVLN